MMANVKRDEIAKLSFEAALQQLEDIVHQLESGEVELDKSIALYQKGQALRKHCEKKLGVAQMKIEQMISKDGKKKRLNVE